MKNSIYLSNAEVYRTAIFSQNGVEMYSKKFDTFQDAKDWSEGMSQAENMNYKIFDNQTNVELAYGPSLTEEEEGIMTEMEHRDLIVQMLLEAGKEPTEDMIKKIAEMIADVHIEEDPQYYEKLEKIGL